MRGGMPGNDDATFLETRRKLEPVVAQGNAEAQLLLGSMHFKHQRPRARRAASSRHLVLVKTQLGTVYTHQEFKTRSLTPIPDLLQRP